MGTIYLTPVSQDSHNHVISMPQNKLHPAMTVYFQWHNSVMLA